MPNVVYLATSVTAVAAAAGVFAKVWQWVHRLQEGQKCLLRAQMLHTYYKHKDEEKIRQYEYENFISCYRAYTAMGGNSFINKICDEVNDWEVMS